MKKIIHKIKNISLLQALFWGIINVVLAQNAFAIDEGELSNPLDSTSISSIIESAANAFIKVMIPVAAIFIIYSGLMFVTARGSEENIKKAKNTFMWTIIGTAIILGGVVIAKALKETISSF